MSRLVFHALTLPHVCDWSLSHPNLNAVGNPTNKNTWEMLIIITLVLGALLGIIFSVIKSGAVKVAPPNLVEKTTRSYSKAEVAVHNKKSDCWIIVKNKVYDVTPYVEEHPGGDAILAHAGDDSTEGFYGPQHATRVFDMVDEFYIGDLKD
ncbi:hypothetical protein H6P81_009053 [Aristolochia fimbriata]|uniref:Cytochrome b5 heme-binding domain-containing protein n=1 Tax=Aristolochia fimbriata TaxID=158543 RepID=A0AAV7EPA8_ARIFI|nr:hypothetical protein H6P81_009053 [Aristolochia fimbriata]